MRVALISDVHANLPALQAVLAHAAQYDVDAIWNAGDFVGYGPFPNAVIALLRAEGALSIAGNYDLKVLQFKSKRVVWQQQKRAEKYLAFRWAYENLSRENRHYLFFLPREVRWKVEDWRLLITHGSPASNSEYLTAYTPKKRMHKLAKMAGVDIVLCGHSHRPFVRRVGGVWFVNPGSVGRSDDGNPQASYAVLELMPGRFDVNHYRIYYDIQAVVTAIKEHNLPDLFAHMLVEGYDLDTIIQKQALEETITNLKTDPVMFAVLSVAEGYKYDAVYTHQVTQLSLKLFDALHPLHQLKSQPRKWLRYAAVLHDIGRVKHHKGYHKQTLDMILSNLSLPFNQRERLIVASVARYHRKALPSEKHAHFAALDPDAQIIVRWLSSILRLASGLSYAYRGLIQDVACEFNKNRIALHCTIRETVDTDLSIVTKKAQLLEIVSGRSVQLQISQAVV